MIPSDVVSRLQPTLDLGQRPVIPARELTERLSGLIAGERLLAQIESLLPNGTYRALINQRNVTLALPFAAKSGDAIELEVTESDGKLTLAVVTRTGDGTGSGNESAATSLSRTGQLISSLLTGTCNAGGDSAAVVLNANQPIAPSPPGSAQDLLPLLERAIARSGMFYESHQAEWVEGRIGKAELLQEPQGKLPPVPSAAAAERPSAHDGLRGDAGSTANDGARLQARASGDVGLGSTTLQPVVSSPSGQAVAPAVQGLVQQQLEAFAAQTFAWQGQVWPGQQIQWEIDHSPPRPGSNTEDGEATWRTRLRLTLPRLGEVDARIKISAEQLTLAIAAREPETLDLLRGSTAILRNQMEQTGLAVAAIGIAATQENPADVAAGD